MDKNGQVETYLLFYFLFGCNFDIPTQMFFGARYVKNLICNLQNTFIFLFYLDMFISTKMSNFPFFYKAFHFTFTFNMSYNVFYIFSLLWKAQVRDPCFTCNLCFARWLSFAYFLLHTFFNLAKDNLLSNLEGWLCSVNL